MDRIQLKCNHVEANDAEFDEPRFIRRQFFYDCNSDPIADTTAIVYTNSDPYTDAGHTDANSDANSRAGRESIS